LLRGADAYRRQPYQGSVGKESRLKQIEKPLAHHS
jgi:hypothetical protein